MAAQDAQDTLKALVWDAVRQKDIAALAALDVPCTSAWLAACRDATAMQRICAADPELWQCVCTDAVNCVLAVDNRLRDVDNEVNTDECARRLDVAFAVCDVMTPCARHGIDKHLDVTEMYLGRTIGVRQGILPHICQALDKRGATNQPDWLARVLGWAVGNCWLSMVLGCVARKEAGAWPTADWSAQQAAQLARVVCACAGSAGGYNGEPQLGMLLHRAADCSGGAQCLAEMLQAVFKARQLPPRKVMLETTLVAHMNAALHQGKRLERETRTVLAMWAAGVLKQLTVAAVMPHTPPRGDIFARCPDAVATLIATMQACPALQDKSTRRGMALASLPWFLGALRSGADAASVKLLQTMGANADLLPMDDRHAAAFLAALGDAELSVCLPEALHEWVCACIERLWSILGRISGMGAHRLWAGIAQCGAAGAAAVCTPHFWRGAAERVKYVAHTDDAVAAPRIARLAATLRLPFVAVCAECARIAPHGPVSYQRDLVQPYRDACWAAQGLASGNPARRAMVLHRVQLRHKLRTASVRKRT